MTSMLGKLAFVVAAAGGLSLAALSPAPVEAGAIHWSQGLAAATGDSDALRVRCVRRASNLWSCNDEVRVRSRRDAGAVIVTPTTPAITPIKPQGTARAAATAPPIGGPAEGNATFV